MAFTIDITIGDHHQDLNASGALGIEVSAGGTATEDIDIVINDAATVGSETMSKLDAINALKAAIAYLEENDWPPA